MIRREVVVTRSTVRSGDGVSIGYCFTTLPILKILAILFCVIIICILEARSYYRYYYGNEGVITFAFVLSIVCLTITLLTLLIYFFRIHTKFISTLPWNTIEIVFDSVAAVLFGLAFGLLVWQCVERYPHQRSDWERRVAAITAFCGANALVYLFSACHANRFIV